MGKPLRICGYAADWKPWDNYGRRWLLRQGAFTRALASNPVKLLVDHDPLLCLGSTERGNVALIQNDYGLRMVADLPDDFYGRMVYQQIKEGRLNQMSHLSRARVGDWTHHAGCKAWEIREADLDEVTLCKQGANPRTCVRVAPEIAAPWDRPPVEERRASSIVSPSAGFSLPERKLGPDSFQGYAVVWNAISHPIGGMNAFRERFAPGAFTRSLKEQSDIFGLLHHNRQLILARTTAGSLRVWQDGYGLGFEMAVKDTSLGRDTRVLVDGGELSGMSFQFATEPGADTWEVGSDGYDLRTVNEAWLYEVSIVDRGAYPAAFVRSEQGLRNKLQSISNRAREIEL